MTLESPSAAPKRLSIDGIKMYGNYQRGVCLLRKGRFQSTWHCHDYSFHTMLEVETGVESLYSGFPPERVLGYGISSSTGYPQVKEGFFTRN
jgi:hypothetical protein